MMPKCDARATPVRARACDDEFFSSWMKRIKSITMHDSIMNA